LFEDFIVFALVAISLFSLTKTTVKQLSNDIVKLSRHPPTTYEIVTGESGNFLTRHIRSRFHEMREILELAGIENKYSSYCRLSYSLAAIGAMIAIVLGNVFLLPVITLLGLFLPILLARISASGYRKQQNAEVLTSLSIITNSYKRTDNFINSVSENIAYIHEPIKAVFKKFLAMNKFVTTNVDKSLTEIMYLVKNDTWREWCETIILCQHDQRKKDMLEPILKKLRNKDSVQLDLDTMLYAPVKEFVFMLALVLINFPMLYYLNRSWFYALIFSIPGKIAVTIVFASFLYSIFAIIRTVSPLEFKR
jgi:hypothetical protein